MCRRRRIPASDVVDTPAEMSLTRPLNACHHVAGFVYAAAHLCEARRTIEIEVRPGAARARAARVVADVAAATIDCPSAAAPLRVHPPVEVRRVLAMRRVQAATAVASSSRSAPGLRQAQAGRGPHAVLGVVGAAILTAGERKALPHQSGGSLPGRGAGGGFRPRTAHAIMRLETTPARNSPTDVPDEPRI